MSIPTTQKALYIKAAKGAWAVESNDVPVPTGDEVLVRVEAVGLNPVDWKIHDYDFGVAQYPVIIGSDAAGVVVALAEDAKKAGKVEVGDRVILQGLRNKRQATFQQYIISSSAVVAKLPPHLSFDEGVSVPVAVATAGIGLYGPKRNLAPNVSRSGAELIAPWKEDGLHKYADEPILVIGGSSAVGQAVIQYAKLSGFSPIITTVSPHNKDLVTSLGATHVIDRTQPLSSLASSVAAITSKPIKVIFDAISLPDTQNASYKVLANGGILILVLSVQVKEEDRVADKEIANPFGTASSLENRQIGSELYAALEGYLASGDIKPNRIEYVPGGLASIPDALDKLRKDKVSGQKLVVRPTETA